MDPKPTATFEEYWTETKYKFMADVNKCLLLNNFVWAVWVMLIMTDSQVYDDDIWHWRFLPGRIEDFKKQKAEFSL